MFISQNWRGKPLFSREVIVNLIGATTTRTGLEVYARLDEREYFHPEWNYTIKPRVDC